MVVLPLVVVASERNHALLVVAHGKMFGKKKCSPVC
jgi:hypothetical protein